MTTKKYEDHHVICLSLSGDDFKENIVRVTIYEHKLIHTTLNIPYYKLRRFRKATNHMIHRNSQQYVDRLRKLHLDYFKNINKLPVKLINLQRDSIRATTKRIVSTHKLTLKLPKDSADIFAWLRSMHYALTIR